MADPASGARHSMALVLESEPGVTPANPTLTPIRHNSTSLGLTKEAVESGELKANRQKGRTRHGNRQVSGDVSSELSFGGAFHQMLEAVLCGTWQADTPEAGTDQLRAGVARRTFTIERLFADLGVYLRYRGCEFNTWSLTVSPNAIVTTTFGVVGVDMNDPATSALAGATYENVTTTEAFDSFTGSITEGGDEIGIVTELSLSLENGINPLFAVGNKTAVSKSIGQSKMTGSLSVFFESEALYQKFLSEQASTIGFALSDGTNLYTVDLGNVNYTAGQPDVSGAGEVTLPLSFTAEEVVGEDSQITMTRGAV